MAEALAALEAAARVLAGARSVLVIDWPSRDVPASLVFAGFAVFVKGGPGPADYNAWELDSGERVSRPLGREPSHVDLVYCHRPFGELPGIPGPGAHDRPVTGSTRIELWSVHYPVDSLCRTTSSLCIIWVNQWTSMAR